MRILIGIIIFLLLALTLISFGNSPFHCPLSKAGPNAVNKRTLARTTRKEPVSFQLNLCYSTCGYLAIMWGLRIRPTHRKQHNEAATEGLRSDGTSRASEEAAPNTSSTLDHLPGSGAVTLLFFILMRCEMYFSMTCHWERTNWYTKYKEARRSQT